MSKSRTEKIFINASAGIVTRFAFILTNFMLRTIFIHTLGVQYVGVSSLFTDILSVLSLTELGISAAISHALYGPIVENDNRKIAQFMNFYKKAYRIISFTIFIIGLAIVPFLDYLVTDVPDIKESIKIIFSLYILKTSVSYLLVYKSTLLVANQKGYLISKTELIVNFTKTIIEGILLIVFGKFMLYLIVEVFANILQNYIISLKSDKEFKNLKIYRDEKLSKKEFKKILLDIKALSMYKISSSIGNGFDSLIVSAFISTTSVGLLSNYALIKNQIYQVLNQFYNAIVPSIGNLAIEENENKQYNVFKEFYFLNYWISCFCSISFLVLITPFISLWIGERYILSFSIVVVLAFDFFLYMMLQPISSFRTANGIFIKGQYRPLITAVVNIFLSLLLVKPFGIVGVIGATIISRIMTQWYDPWLLYKYIFKQSFIDFYKVYIYNIISYTIIAFVTFKIAQITYVDNFIISFFIQIMICLIIPNALIIILYYNTKEFKSIIRMFFNLIKKNISE